MIIEEIIKGRFNCPFITIIKGIRLKINNKLKLNMFEVPVKKIDEIIRVGIERFKYFFKLLVAIVK
jgi:hypothetical protein